jgi:hypothetical protein
MDDQRDDRAGNGAVTRLRGHGAKDGAILAWIVVTGCIAAFHGLFPSDRPGKFAGAILAMIIGVAIYIKRRVGAKTKK